MMSKQKSLKKILGINPPLLRNPGYVIDKRETFPISRIEVFIRVIDFQTLCVRN